MGNCIAVNGRFRTTKAVYPLHSVRDTLPSFCRSIRSACRDEDRPAVLDRCITWAFCLITSAGVSTRHEAISAPAEAMAWMTGPGVAAGKACARSDLADS